MLLPTHLVTGQTAFLMCSVATGHPPTLAEALVALLAAALPDLDSWHSYTGRLAYVILPFGFFLALLSGWVSHSLADMMTPAGFCWFWPSRVRCVIPVNVKYRMDSMSRGELTFLVIMALCGLLLKPLAGSGQGTMGLIRSAIGNIASAREDYDAQKGSHAWSLEVKGRDNRSYDDISGTND